VVRVSKRALISLSSAVYAQPFEGLNPSQISGLILQMRDSLIAWIRQHDLHLFMLVLAVPLALLMYYDAKLVFRELRDVTAYVVRRKELLPSEKSWYRWRIGFRALGIVVLSFSITLLAGALAWMGQFKHLDEMFSALEKMRREESILTIITRMLESLRGR